MAEKNNSQNPTSDKGKKETGKSATLKSNPKSGKSSSKKKASKLSQRTKKEDKLKQHLKEAREETQQLKDQLLRTVAELDNYKKRKAKEMNQLIDNANERLILNILPVVDDFERSLKISTSENSVEFRKGAELIYQKLKSVLSSEGVEPIESVGQSFDVDLHDALLQVEAKDTAPNTVVEEHEKGYLLKSKILRHAKVIVSK